MNGQNFSLSHQPISSEGRSPVSYRAYAVQEDVRCMPGMTRAQSHFIEASEVIARSKRSAHSVTVGVLLAIVFGPIGMLYSTEIGAAVMAAIEGVAMLRMQVPIVVTAWIVGVFWAAAVGVVRNRQFEETT